MPASCSVALITAPHRGAALKISRGLLEKRLAACVNIVPGLESLYWWKRKIERAKEVLLIVKTRSGLLPGLIRHVRRTHPYKVPEIVCWDIRKGNREYLRWVGLSTRGGR